MNDAFIATIVKSSGSGFVTSPEPCKIGWHPNRYSSTCLKVFNTTATWDEAREECRNQGGDLVKVLNQKMHEALIELTSISDEMWIGLKKENSYAKFEWSKDQSKMTYNVSSKPGSPRGLCILQKTKPALQAEWQETYCQTKHAFMCEKVPEVSLCPLGWTAYWGSGTCIKAFQEKLNWTMASQTCMAKNGKLVAVRNAVMNDFIGDFVRQDRSKNNWLWIGLNNLNATYMRWNDENKPTDYTTGLPVFWTMTQWCAAVNTHNIKKWKGLPPRNTFDFICEKTAELFCDGMIYHMICTQNCSSGCKENLCDAKTGLCINGCDKGYRGYFCDEECPKNTYGSNCSETCSSNCFLASPLCEKESGFCLKGCLDGFFGDRCDSPCPNNTFGTNCWRYCSPNCAGSGCDKKDGHCLNGCNDGYFGDLCQEACSNKTYGANCSETCSKNCLNTSCSHVDGRCLGRCVSGYEGMWCDTSKKSMVEDTGFLELVIVVILVVFGIALFAIMCIALPVLKNVKTSTEESVKKVRSPTKVHADLLRVSLTLSDAEFLESERKQFSTQSLQETKEILSSTSVVSARRVNMSDSSTSSKDDEKKKF